MKPLVYLAGPMTGLSPHEANNWRVGARRALLPDIECLSPMRDKEHLYADNIILHARYVGDPLGSGRGNVARDISDIRRSDLVLINYLGATRISRGTTWESGFLYALNKSCVLVIEATNNPHDDIFLEETARMRFDNIPAALDAIRSFLLPG
jgi:nucleoside 2-deoxyribosyltransferase